MLQLSSVLWKYPRVTTDNIRKVVKLQNLSTATVSKTQSPPANDDKSMSIEGNTKIIKPTRKSNIKIQNTLVSAAFASLQEERTEDMKTPLTDQKMLQAKNVDELLSISEGSGVSRKHALRTVSILSDWHLNGKVQLIDFENDPRFIKLCRVLTKNSVLKAKSYISKSEDLSTVLSVTADDEAAKLVGSITLAQMVKVMSTLSMKKRRSTLLLRSLAYNITASQEKLDLKQAADLFYSISVLNFPDENLLARLSDDICNSVNSQFKKSSVVGSILTSVGLLRYKDPVLLDALSEVIVKNSGTCRPQDIFALFMTLGTLNYTPCNSDRLLEVFLPQMTKSEAASPATWLEVVWSLLLLNQASHHHISSVFDESFIHALKNKDEMKISAKLKLLNIDAYVNYIDCDYKGPRLSKDSVFRQVDLPMSKEKSKMVNSLIDTLKSLIQNDKCLRTNVNSGAGFCIDVECAFDKNVNPVPVDFEERKDVTKLAFLAHDYHDMCVGKIEPTGVNCLAVKILEKMGYKVIVVPYTEFNFTDKIVTRVKYLEKKLKAAVQ